MLVLNDRQVYLLSDNSQRVPLGTNGSSPPQFASLPRTRLWLYTGTQSVLFGACWAVTVSPWGLAFPAVIAAMVATRKVLLPREFSSVELAMLDTNSGALVNAT